MIIDSSALVALVKGEPSAPLIAASILRDDVREVGAATFVESSMVIEARMPDGARLLAELIETFDIDIVPVEGAIAGAAVEAWRRFGKGNHPARLNLGDCLTYGVATVRGEPILCIGNDFVQTDAPIVPLG